MAQHQIMLTLDVSDRQYIQIIKAQQESGKYTVESYLRGIILETLSAPKPVKKKAKVVKVIPEGTISEGGPVAIKKKLIMDGVTVMKEIPLVIPDVGGPEAEFAPSPSK